MTNDPRAIATEMIRSAAGDIDTLAIGEHLGEHDVDDPDGGITEQVDELLRAARVTVGWPTDGPSEPADAIDLDAIEARANAATDGPWFPIVPADGATEWFDPYDDPMVVTADSNPGNYCAIAQDISNGKSDGAADAEFIAAARTDVPALAAEVRRLRASVKQLIDFRNVTVAERDALRDRVKAVRAIAGPEVLAVLGEPHPAESRPAVVFPA